MTQTGTLSGLGKLWDGNNDLGPVGYEIRLIQDAGPKRRGEGTLSWTGHVPQGGFQAGKILMLMLKSGEQVSITINSARKNGADILATGPLPDPVDWSTDD